MQPPEVQSPICYGYVPATDPMLLIADLCGWSMMRCLSGLGWTALYISNNTIEDVCHASGADDIECQKQSVCTTENE